MLKKSQTILIASTLLIIGLLTSCFFYQKKILDIYRQEKSIKITDRHGELIYLKPNSADYFAEYLTEVPENIKGLLLKKEDRYFYYHPGFNPLSILRSIKNKLNGDRAYGASTITQQLAKILLKNENERTLGNKFQELAGAVSLEIFQSKDEILIMYVNSIFLGNNTQGLNSASRMYFNKPPDKLSDEEIISLLATINNPTNFNPFKEKNYSHAKIIAPNLGKNDLEFAPLSQSKIDQLKEDFAKYRQADCWFELKSLNIDCESDCRLSIDKHLSENLRKVVKDSLQFVIAKNATNASVVVIKEPENELLAIIGSPDYTINSYGYQINMAVKPRPIGSTIKPFIYLKGFEKNLRPYTMVEDKEYKYTIGTGFAFYPKNYDYEYRGLVNLHYALSNSLNVPTVKVLEYVGVDDFNNFLLNDLKFEPIQDLKNYQLGIALGELEMDLMNLTDYFSIFTNHGELKPLTISQAQKIIDKSGIISELKYIQLVNKILSDRKTGVEQFGVVSNLTLPIKNYAVKTGTSREYHDSWIVGYTPGFIVGAWVGNSDDTAMDSVSGESGAGKIWNQAMNLLINSDNYSQQPFDSNLIHEYQLENDITFGLKGDDYEKYKNLLIENNLIENPHNGDTFLFEDNTQIFLKSKEKVEWLVNGFSIGVSNNLIYRIPTIGQYEIEAKLSDQTEKIIINVENDIN